MATRTELEDQLKHLPQPPFFALLTSHREHLGMVDRQRAAYVCPRGLTKPLFVVAEVAIDRCFEQPGIWVRAVDSVATTTNVNLIYSYNSARKDIWLNLEWCVVYAATKGTPFNPN